MTYRECLDNAIEILKASGNESPSYDAMILLECVTGMNRTRFLMDRDTEMEDDKAFKMLSFAEKRATGYPLQRITGSQEFMGIDISVNEHVLIPRQDTEVLVEEVLKVIEPGKKVADMCTGSGCIALAIKAFRPDAEVSGYDISEKALETAIGNAEKNNLKVTFEKSDLFSNIEEIFDVIVSNPPYIRTDEIDKLTVDVKDYEPRLALDGLEDGLHFYRRICEEAPLRLNKGGYLCFEIGFDQGDDVSLIMKDNGFTDIKVIKDLAGLDRVVCGRRD